MRLKNLLSPLALAAAVSVAAPLAAPLAAIAMPAAQHPVATATVTQADYLWQGHHYHYHYNGHYYDHRDRHNGKWAYH